MIESEVSYRDSAYTLVDLADRATVMVAETRRGMTITFVPDGLIVGRFSERASESRQLTHTGDDRVSVVWIWSFVFDSRDGVLLSNRVDEEGEATIEHVAPFPPERESMIARALAALAPIER